MSTAKHEIYLALGSNLGDRADNLRRALRALRPALSIEALSRCYETDAAYVLDQPNFYNMACRAAAKLTPLETLRLFKRIEVELGRQPSIRFGPRLIDIDLLFYDDLMFDSPELTLPHPRLHERAFVLVPLADIAPDVVHPKLGLSAAALLESLGEERQQVRPAPEEVSG